MVPHAKERPSHIRTAFLRTKASRKEAGRNNEPAEKLKSFGVGKDSISDGGFAEVNSDSHTVIDDPGLTIMNRRRAPWVQTETTTCRSGI